MTSLTESQFHTVWTEAVGREGYSKILFRNVLNALYEQGLIKKDQLDDIPIQTIENHLRKKKLNNLSKL